MRQAFRAEWTKLRTVASTGWLLASCIALTIGLSAAVCAAVTHSPGDDIRDTTKISLTGVVLGQAIVASLAVLMVASEYSTGMMRITLAATPRRSVVVAAKAMVVSAATFAAGTIAVLGSLLAGRLIMPGKGFTMANGYTPLSLADGPTLRAAVGSVLYLVFIALLSLGVATLVRDSAIAVAAVLALLYLFPILEALFTDPDWQRRVRQVGPMSAGLGIQSTIDLRSLPLAPWAGLGVLSAWAAGALLLGGLVLKSRATLERYVGGMILAPRYDGPTILTVDGSPGDQLAPLTRQRRRMETMLAGLTDREWVSQSRCAEWSVREVVAHVVGVNTFWHMSIVAGLAGKPTRVLPGFDPATTPSLMVDRTSSRTHREILDEFVATNEALLSVVDDLTDDGWSMLAESPAGHVSVRLLAQHALWDCWIHERDVALPLGLTPAVEPDELRSCLQYAAAVSPVLGMGVGDACTGSFAVEATDPSIRFVLDVGESVAVHDGSADADVPCLRGDAVALIEGLSLRAPMPSSTPIEWSHLLGGLATAFDAGDLRP